MANEKQVVRIFCRECQECGHIQKAKDPQHKITTSYERSKCRKCKSESLDYGHDGYIEENGKIVRYSEDWT